MHKRRLGGSGWQGWLALVIITLGMASGWVRLPAQDIPPTPPPPAPAATPPPPIPSNPALPAPATTPVQIKAAPTVVPTDLPATEDSADEPEPTAPVNVRVDATEAARRIFHVKLAFPVRPGPLMLTYPKFVPGEHGPTGPINSVVNLRLNVGGKPVAWQRDPVDMYALHCQVPVGARTLNVVFDYVSVTEAGDYSTSTASTPRLALIQWNQLVLYPAGPRSDDIPFRASLHLPAGWKFGTALPVETAEGQDVQFHPVSLTTLVDSPIVAGEHFRSWPLTTPGQFPSNQLDAVADSAGALALPDEDVARLRQLVVQARALFGAVHYGQYHFLVGLSDHIDHNGLEHHESSLNTEPERAFIDPDQRANYSDLLPHEFVHSWNGKYRRPVGLATPDYQAPMQGQLLWVYEGMTQYLGSLVLTSRAGLRDVNHTHDWLAAAAAFLDKRPGRAWRPLQDTATAAQLLYGSPTQWRDLRRRVDFYDEGVFLWLGADALIRRSTNGAKSLDDFCHLFFDGGQDTPPSVKPYTLEDLTGTLNAVSPQPWPKYLRERLDTLKPSDPVGALSAVGWKIVYTDQPNREIKLREDDRKLVDLTFSLGLVLKEDGSIVDLPGGSDTPAMKAGLAPGMKVVAVNGRTFSTQVLRDALKAGTAEGSPTLELLTVNEEFYKAFSLDYHGGERYPHLARDESKPDVLEAILKPRTPAAP